MYVYLNKNRKNLTTEDTESTEFWVEFQSFPL